MSQETPDLPSEETMRLAALKSYEVLDTPPEVIFDELARMAASLCGTPIALVSLIDGTRQWFKAHHGIDATETPRELAFCAHAIKGLDPLIVPDARCDARFASNPLVTGEPRIRFYAGAPLITHEGKALGTLCVIDREPRELTPDKIETLTILSRHVVAQLELRRRLKEVSQTHVRRTREMRDLFNEQQGRIEQLSHYNSLTGLATRELFLKRLDEKLVNRGGRHHATTVFVIELQRFDLLAEAIGSHSMDALLAEIGRRVIACAQDPVDVAQLREERFALLRTDVQGPTAAAVFAETTLLPRLAQPFHVNDHELRPSLKVGVGVSPGDGVDAASVLRAAKTALVSARADSQDVAFSSPEIAARVADALRLEMKLRRAIERREFIVHYQPKIDLLTGRITGVEALLRWADPDAQVRADDGRPRLVPPARFIPLLEETGLIVPVGRLVLEQAVADHREWQRRGLPAPRIAVNVSTLQLQKEFVSDVLELIGTQGDCPIDIEITEATFLEQGGDTVEHLQRLRARGVRVALDDFGTGYSSLRYLSDLPIDVLKIDRSFVEGIVTRPKDLAIVSSIIGLARGLGFRTVAEGVETEEQKRFLRAIQCDEMQGYLFSRPLPKAELEQLLVAHRD